MRPPLFFALAALLTGLPAQDLPPRPPFAMPAAAAEAPNASVTPEVAALRAAAARSQLTGHTQYVRFDQPRADGPLWALGTAWKASFDERGFTVIPFFGTNAPRNFPLRLELAQATVGGEALPLAAGKPIVTDTTVRTDRGALTEVVDTHLDSLEQSFVFDALPNRGAIAVEVRMSGELQPTTIANGLRFRNEFGHVDYTKAVAVDAKGQRLPLDIVWTGTTARMEIPAAFVEQAQLPIVLDPVLNYWYLLASGVGQLQHDPDVASIQAPLLGGRTLLVWQRQWSQVDHDCFGLMFDANLGLVATDFPIDFSGEDWVKVAVAGNNYAQNFLVVAEIWIATLPFIGGRGIAPNATVGGLFDIERNGVVGIGGNNHHPDVGCDLYAGPSRYTVVFNKRNGSTSDIYYKQVSGSYALVTTNPIALDTSPNHESTPSISKSCGQSSGPPAQWLVTWQRTFPSPPNDQEVYGRFVTWNGNVAGAAFPIAYSVGEETGPAPGSPIDVEGVRYWPVCYEYASTFGQPHTVLGTLHRSDGVMQQNFLVSNVVPGRNDFNPSVDSDGTRFVVSMTTSIGAGPRGVEAITMAYLPATNQFRVEERSSLATSSLDDYGHCSVCADYSGGQARTPRYMIAFTELTTNTFRLEAFGGYAGTTNFFSTRPSQCGNLSITASGSPVIGQTVTITVGSAGFSGTILGFPAHVPFNAGCNCWLGVDPSVTMGNPLVWTVPNNPAYVGVALAAQGWTFSGSMCLGAIDISDTVDFTVR